MSQPIELLFVCTANICRSPMAEAIFNALASDSGLDARAHSAGVAALEGYPAHSNAVSALEEVGISLGKHRARRVREELVTRSDLVLAMTPEHVKELNNTFEGQSHKFHLLPGYAGTDLRSIPDPYGLTMPAHRASVRKLSECMENVIATLQKAEKEHTPG